LDIVQSIWLRLDRTELTDLVSDEKAADRRFRQKFSSRLPEEIEAEKVVQHVMAGSVKDELKAHSDMSMFSPLGFVYSPDTAFDHVLDAFSAQRGLHRVLVKKDGQHYVVSQTDAVRTLWDYAAREKRQHGEFGSSSEYCEELDCYNHLPCSRHSNHGVLSSILNRTLEDLDLANPVRARIYSIKSHEPTVAAFKLMTEHGVSGVAVLDENDELVGTLSSSELRGMNSVTLVNSLWLPASQLLKLGPQVTCTVKDTLWSVVEKLVEHKIHRLWVCENKKVVSVVTLTDVISRCRILASK